MATGSDPCPNCGFAYDSHAVGGNCPVLKIKKKKGK